MSHCTEKEQKELFLSAHYNYTAKYSPKAAMKAINQSSLENIGNSFEIPAPAEIP